MTDTPNPPLPATPTTWTKVARPLLQAWHVVMIAVHAAFTLMLTYFGANFAYYTALHVGGKVRGHAPVDHAVAIAMFGAMLLAGCICAFVTGIGTLCASMVIAASYTSNDGSVLLWSKRFSAVPVAACLLGAALAVARTLF